MIEALKIEFGWGTLKATDIVDYVPMIISKDNYKYITGQEYQENKEG
ncbi:MAG TPA: XkdX family protein [Candidatus Companilactobacillus pullicola]|uniref:XkdX family protein n=1 Tax=Candidatus Companilactobacillus pullicola TaxID=2838523 RepID=A0A9D2CNE7_9LACO|nr:XkdX family protein [Candidatus Companilactobacillus pullicola]